MATTRNTPRGTTAGSDAAWESEHGYISDKAWYLTRLERIEGQARGIHRLVQEEKYFIDILTQVSALSKALESGTVGLHDDHLKHCVMDTAAAGGSAAEPKLAVDLRRYRPPGASLTRTSPPHTHFTPTLSNRHTTAPPRKEPS